MERSLLIRNRNHRKTGSVLLAVCVSTLLLACQKPETTVTLIETQPSEALDGTPFDPTSPPKYMLYPGDLLLIRYPTDSSLDQEVRIRSDGKISLPYVGDIQAAYRGPEDLTTELNEKCREVLNDPKVTVIVVSEAGRHVYFGGEVRIPGALALKPNQTLAQGLIQSGGLTMEANAKQVMVLRYRPGEGTYVLATNLERILAGRAPDIALQPYDIVYVPESIIANVNRFVKQYINLMIPRAVNFPFNTEIHNEPVKIIGRDNTLAPIQITR